MTKLLEWLLQIVSSILTVIAVVAMYGIIGAVLMSPLALIGWVLYLLIR